MVPGRISNTLSHAMQRWQRLLVATVMVVLVVMLVTVFALSSGSAAVASRPGRTVSEPRLPLHTGRGGHQTGHQADIPQWHGKGGFGFALVGTAPAGAGSSITAIDEETNTIYVANGFNPNGPKSAGGNTVSVIDGRRCKGTDVSRCKGPWPTLTVGNEPSNIAVDEATDTLYVTNATDNTVSVVNGAICNAQVTSGCNQTPATVPVGLLPLAIFADDTNHTVYVANQGPNLTGTTLSMIDTAVCNGSHLAGCVGFKPPTMSVGTAPGDVDVNQTTHTVYVALLGGVAAFDANTCNAKVLSGCGTIGVLTGDPNGYFSAKVDSANNTIYTANFDNTASAFDGRMCNASDLAGCATEKPGNVIVNGGTFFDVSIWVAVDVPLHSVYVSSQKDDYLAVIDTNICNGRHLTACATLKPPTIHTGANPQLFALNQATQTLYVANEVDNNVSVINALLCNATFTAGCRHPAPEVNVRTGVSAIAVDTAVQTAYVANGNMNTVSMINTQNCNASSLQGCARALPTASVGASPNGIAIDNQTHTVYVTNFGSGATGTVTVIDATTCNATHSSGCSKFKVLQVPGGNPGGIAINQATDTLYVATLTRSGPDIVSVFNGATCDASQSLGCTQKPAVIRVGNSGGSVGSELSLAVNQVTNTIYATNLVLASPLFMGNRVYVINGATCDATNTTGCGKSPAMITAGHNPWGIAVDEATDTIYTANIAGAEFAATVSVINGATCNGSNTSGCGQTPLKVPVGFGAVGITVDNAANRIYVANIQDTSVSVINGSTCNATMTAGCRKTPPKVAVGLAPFAAAVDQGVATVYVLNSVGTVSVIPASQ
jgi:DNA-binding beta-propeller fold protein YncE